MGRGRDNRCYLSLFCPVLLAAFARFKAKSRTPARRSHLADSYAFGRSFLVHAPGIHLDRLAVHLRSCCGPGPWWFVVLFLHRAIETTPGASGTRSKSRGRP